ncbi:heterogeneous nuclear ribonucleoprotein A1 isoform X2 [Octopus sinensis]|uniref:Heterogeneous nuclear ribonucleoprotein A1 isoform X2 n=1 Tax=Octopus sinensis TaxID=2607531 RepID=A0A6P7SFY9_9MOLL|nr:heterogeneous nuclear ribonucleoprotein A1 isoform X2 [Octopus sinensis]
MPEVQRYRNGEDEKFCKLFIGGLNYSTTEEGLKSHFEQWGEIVDCVVMRDLTTKRSRGFGFVTYKTEDMLDEAQKHRPHKVDNREVDTKRAIPRSEADESQAAVKKMFVGGLKEGTTEDEIKERFESYGTIEKIELIKDKATGKQRGFCFVTYNDPDAVDKCVLRKRIQLNGKVVEVKKAVSKTEIERSGRGGMRGGSDYGMRDNFDDNYGGGGNWNMGGENNWGNSGGYPNQGGGGWNQGGQGGWNQGFGQGNNTGCYGGNFNPRGNFNNNFRSGDYDGNNWNNPSNFGTGYGGSGNTGPMRGGNYSQRSSGPYGGGYGAGGGGGGMGYNRR